MLMFRRPFVCHPALCAVVLAYGLLAIPGQVANAQTGSAMLLAPWNGKQFEASGSAAIFMKADAEDDAGDIRLNRYDAQGRLRLMPPAAEAGPAGAGLDPVLGFDVVYLDINPSDDFGLPEKLVDTRAGVGLTLGGSDGWTVQLAAGGGYAGDNPYADSNGWYATGDLIVSYQADPQTRWIFILNYDGHRSIFPDVPLPAVAYQRYENENLAYMIGFPVSTLFWKPHPQWTVDVQYALPLSGSATVTFTPVEGWDVFLSGKSHFNAFSFDDDGREDRIFFRQYTAELGTRLRVHDGIEIVGGIGYAFGQEFSTGFDVRETDNEVDIDSTGFARIGAEIRF